MHYCSSRYVFFPLLKEVVVSFLEFELRIPLRNIFGIYCFYYGLRGQAIFWRHNQAKLWA